MDFVVDVKELLTTGSEISSKPFDVRGSLGLDFYSCLNFELHSNSCESGFDDLISLSILFNDLPATIWLSDAEQHPTC